MQGTPPDSDSSAGLIPHTAHVVMSLPGPSNPAYKANLLSCALGAASAVLLYLAEELWLR
jgi:hypothetical protein